MLGYGQTKHLSFNSVPEPETDVNTGGRKWAVDPVFLSNRVPEAQVLDGSITLQGLQFILLTHAHMDHMDVTLWRQLHRAPCHWVVPEHMVDRFSRETARSEGEYSVAVPGKVLHISGATITPFATPHSERLPAGQFNRVDATGYCVEVAGQSYLFPGDVRTFDTACLEPFTGVAAVFAHVFLGRSAALAPNPPLFDAFVAFYLHCRPKTAVLTHLYELPREPEACWLMSHAAAVAAALLLGGLFPVEGMCQELEYGATEFGARLSWWTMPLPAVIH